MYSAVAITLVIFVASLQCVLTLDSNEDHYTTRFDSIDVEQILTNDRIFKRYVDCLLDKGRCTPEARELKKVLPDALQTECKKCSAVQRKHGAKVIQFIIKNDRAVWNELLLKYDPEGLFRKKYNYRDEDTIDEVLKQFARDHPHINSK